MRLLLTCGLGSLRGRGIRLWSPCLCGSKFGRRRRRGGRWLRSKFRIWGEVGLESILHEKWRQGKDVHAEPAPTEDVLLIVHGLENPGYVKCGGDGRVVVG